MYMNDVSVELGRRSVVFWKTVTSWKINGFAVVIASFLRLTTSEWSNIWVLWCMEKLWSVEKKSYWGETDTLVVKDISSNSLRITLFFSRPKKPPSFRFLLTTRDGHQFLVPNSDISKDICVPCNRNWKILKNDDSSWQFDTLVEAEWWCVEI